VPLNVVSVVAQWMYSFVQFEMGKRLDFVLKLSSAK